MNMEDRLASSPGYSDGVVPEFYGRRYAVFNPHGKPLSELPTIWGFNNGGSDDWWNATLLTDNGYFIGSHICSHEGFMRGDLGI